MLRFFLPLGTIKNFNKVVFKDYLFCTKVSESYISLDAISISFWVSEQESQLQLSQVYLMIIL